MHSFVSISCVVSVQVRIFPSNIYVAWWWEKYLSKHSLIKQICLWCDKLIALWTLNRQVKIFLWISNNCNLRDALIAPVIGLFHWIPFFTQETVSLLLPFVYQVDPYFVNSIDMCSMDEITKIYVFKKSTEKKLYSSFEKVWLFFLIFTEEIAFLSYFSESTQALKYENWKCKDYGVYLINVFRMSPTLKRNLTKLVYVWREKNPKTWNLHIFIISKKKNEIWNVNSNMVFP